MTENKDTQTEAPAQAETTIESGTLVMHQDREYCVDKVRLEAGRAQLLMYGGHKAWSDEVTRAVIVEAMDPIPWSLTSRRSDALYRVIRSASGMDVATLYGAKSATPNAEYIVRAVNCHDDLVEAAMAARKYDEAITACANNPAKMSSYCTAEGEDLDALYMDWMTKSRAALAKAEGRAA